MALSHSHYKHNMTLVSCRASLLQEHASLNDDTRYIFIMPEEEDAKEEDVMGGREEPSKRPKSLVRAQRKDTMQDETGFKSTTIR